MNDAPILSPSGPFLRNVHHGEIQHFQQAVIRRKNGFGFGDLAKLAIEPFDGIGRIDQPANFLREFEICAQVWDLSLILCKLQKAGVKTKVGRGGGQGTLFVALTAINQKSCSPSRAAAQPLFIFP